MNMFVLFTLYVSVFPYLMKITASIFILFFIVVIYLEKKSIAKLILLSLVASFPFTVLDTYAVIHERKLLYDRSVGADKQQVVAIKNIANMVNTDKESIVQCLYYDLDNISRDIFLTALPVSNEKGFPIIYSYTIFQSDIPYEENFSTCRILNIEFLLSARELKNDNLVLLQKNNYFYFYKKNNH